MRTLLAGPYLIQKDAWNLQERASKQLIEHPGSAATGHDY